MFPIDGLRKKSIYILQTFFFLLALLYAEQGVALYKATPNLFTTVESDRLQKASQFIADNMLFDDIVLSDQIIMDPEHSDGSSANDFTSISFKYSYKAMNMDELVKIKIMIQKRLHEPLTDSMRLWYLSEGKPSVYWQKYIDSSKEITNGRFYLNFILNDAIVRFLDEEASPDTYTF